MLMASCWVRFVPAVLTVALLGSAIGATTAADGRAGSDSASWQMAFAEPRRIGAILQIHGDDPEVLRNAPRNYIWQTSSDGQTWRHLLETSKTITGNFLRLAQQWGGTNPQAQRLVPPKPRPEVFDEL
jgi:hypothetical protein